MELVDKEEVAMLVLVALDNKLVKSILVEVEVLVLTMEVPHKVIPQMVALE